MDDGHVTVQTFTEVYRTGKIMSTKPRRIAQTSVLAKR